MLNHAPHSLPPDPAFVNGLVGDVRSGLPSLNSSVRAILEKETAAAAHVVFSLDVCAEIGKGIDENLLKIDLSSYTRCPDCGHLEAGGIFVYWD